MEKDQAKHTIRIYNNQNANHRLDILSNININKEKRTEIFCCSINPEDDKVALACGDGTVKIYDINDPKNSKAKIIKTFESSIIKKI